MNIRGVMMQKQWSGVSSCDITACGWVTYEKTCLPVGSKLPFRWRAPKEYGYFLAPICNSKKGK